MGKKKNIAAQLVASVGGLQVMARYWGKTRLTVLAYHRIIEHNTPQFADLRPVVTATPAMFAQQMAYIQANFRVISIEDLHAAIVHDKPLPPNPLLITFDDGYLDNYQFAYPILKQMGFPALIFLVTSRMTDPRPLWWDALARAVNYNTQAQIDLPLLGLSSFADSEKPHTLNRLMAALKPLPNAEKEAVVQSILASLHFTDPDDSPLFVNWEQVREMVNDGIACHAHTVTHPIMTRIPLEQARSELVESRQRIIDETAQAVTSFAYPNGTSTDYSPQVMQLLRETGYDLAFTLTPGPMTWRDAQRYPLQIRRVYLGYTDTMAVFKAKVMGLPALGERIAYP